MEIDDDLFRRMGSGAAANMNHTDVMEEEEVQVLVPRTQKTPVRTVPDFPSCQTLREKIFNDPDASIWSLSDAMEVGLQASINMKFYGQTSNNKFWMTIWNGVEHKIAFASKITELRGFIYELQARALAFDLDLEQCGMLHVARLHRFDVDETGHRLSKKNLYILQIELRLLKHSHNCSRLKLAREKDLATGLESTHKLYLDIIAAVHRGTQVKICLQGQAGTGKTFFLNTLIARLYHDNKLVIAMNTTRGGLDTLLGGELFGDRFRVNKYALNDFNDFHMDLTPAEERALAAVDLLIFDGCQRMPAQHFVMLDKLLRKIMGKQDVFMGGKSIVMAADWAQPIDEARPSMRFLARNKCFDTNMGKVTFEQNFRFSPLCSRQWRAFIKNASLRHGYLEDIPLEVQQIALVQGVDAKKCGMSELINFVYNNIDWQIGQGGGNPTYFYSRVILTRQATFAEMINNFIVKQLPAGWFMEVSQALDSRPNMQKVGRLLGPPYQLKLSPGMPLVLTQDLNRHRGLLKGTLLYFESLSDYVMRTKRRLVEDGAFETIILNKTITKMRANEDWAGFPSRIFERVQFPVRPAFAQVLTKAEGKTYERVGVLWTKEPARVLHGELYLALTRVRNPRNLAICVPWHLEDMFKTPNDFDNYSVLMDSLSEKFGLINTVFNF